MAQLLNGTSFESTNDMNDSQEYWCEYYYYKSGYYNRYERSFAASVTVLVVCALVLFVGIVGNVLVLIVIGAVKSMHTTVNRCLFALALADLIVLVFGPIPSILDDYLHYVVDFGEHFCKFQTFYDRGSGACSILIFLFVTMDRYFAFCHPLKSRRRWTGKKTYFILFVIWAITCGFSIPYVVATEYETHVVSNISYYYCLYTESEWFKWYDGTFTVLFFLLPAPLLCLLYGKMINQIRTSVKMSSISDVEHGVSGRKEKKTVGVSGRKEKKKVGVSGRRAGNQVVVMLFSVVVIFIVSQLPFSIFTLIDHASLIIYNAPLDEQLFLIIWVCRIVIFINSASNPILYFTLSTNFRHSFKKVFCFCRKEQVSKWPSRTSSSDKLPD